MGSLPNLHELGGKEPTSTGVPHVNRPRQPLARVPTAPAQHQRVFKSKSNGHASNHVNDDLILDVSAYSPVSSRHPRSIRRRDSLSSIGATSLRRLLTVRPTLPGPGEHRRAAHSLLALCCAHACGGAALLPFLALQAGGGAWMSGWGPILTAGAFLTAAITAILGPWLVQKIGVYIILAVLYITMGVFFAGHLVGQIGIVIPLYVILGIVTGPSSVARSTSVLLISSRLTNSHPCEDEEAKTLRRTTILRRAARALHFAHDLGLIVGSGLAASVITFTGNADESGSVNGTDWENVTDIPTSNIPTIFSPSPHPFYVDESGERICGARACPRDSPSVNPPFADILAGMFAGLSILGLVAVGVFAWLRPRPVHEPRPGPPALRATWDTYKDYRMQLAAPLAVWIGMEQAFMFTDFTKSYVVCTLGIDRIPLVFLSQGLLQSIAAATLSMLLRSIQTRRCLVVAVGFAFHACLLLVQLAWKPSGDDPALFYVISAAWGVCHAIWEQLSWTFLVGSYGEQGSAAFGNSLAWRYLGMSLVFGVQGLLCVRVQLYALAGGLVLAAVPSAALEHRMHNLKKLRSISRL